MQKICNKCGISKEIIAFHKNNTYKGKQYYASKCKACIQLDDQLSYKKNKDKKKVTAKEYYNEHKDECKLRMSKYQKTHLEEHRQRCKKYSQTHKQEKSSYFKNRRATDPTFKLLTNLRTRLNSALKGVNKSASTLSLIGCTTDELKLHLQKQFVANMYWNNYGKWHVDHIKPCASFDLTNIEEQQRCFHYSNLQPLWAVDNLKKSNNINVSC